MKNLSILLITVFGLVFFNGCQNKSNPNVCHIQGELGSNQYDGKRIFLVPLKGAQTAETVDSVVIKDSKFEFYVDTMQMYKILIDYHYRLGTQTLLVVSEPGELKVTIDSISHGGGTPQNDSLEQWKARTLKHNQQLGMIRKLLKSLPSNVDKRLTESLNANADSIHLAYKRMTRQMAQNMKGSVLSEFLGEMYPTTYKKKLPDGRIVTINADTNEEIPE